MHYQELIYLQDESFLPRNHTVSCVNMSSDLCIYEAPTLIATGATTIDCSGYTQTYEITTETSIDIGLGAINLGSFSANTSTLRFEIYKLKLANPKLFTKPPVFVSEDLNFSQLTGGTEPFSEIPLSVLKLDGTYLIKPYYKFGFCTEIGSKLGLTIDTKSLNGNTEYGLYNSETDFVFNAYTKASKPIFQNNGTNIAPPNSLYQQIIKPSFEGQTIFSINSQYVGIPVITLNGLVLANSLDYTFTGNTLTFLDFTTMTDIITVIYDTGSGSSLFSDSYKIDYISSGLTNGQGSDVVYFNTDTNKYEVYMSVMPQVGNDILLMINGLTLVYGIDFYQSVSNGQRLILEGDIIIGDVITIVYYPINTVVGTLLTPTATISWSIAIPPQNTNGRFILEVYKDENLTISASTIEIPYVIGNANYYGTFISTGDAGNTLYYRVKNEKTFIDICDNHIISVAYSDVIPIIIGTNAINTY